MIHVFSEYNRVFGELPRQMQSAFFLLEMFSAALVFSIPLEKRSRWPLRLVLWLFAITVFLWTTAVYIHPGFSGNRLNESEAALAAAGFQLIIGHFISCCMIFAWMVTEIWSICRVSFREAAYCGACAYLMEHAAYCVRLLAEYYVPGLSAGPGSLLYIFIHCTVYVAFYFLFARRMVRSRHYSATVLGSLRLTITVLAVVLVLSLVASSYSFENIHAVYALIFSFFALYTQIDRQQQLYLAEELRFQQELAAQQKAQYEMSRENIEIINRKCHDLKHQLAALKQIRDEKVQDKVISSLEDSVMIYDSMFRTGNDILDTVLTEKSLVCGRERITLSCMADGKLLEFMDPVDIYTLFGNALDNAIEAVSKLAPDDRQIDLGVRKAAGLTIIKLSNRYNGDIHFQDGLPQTSKEDKNYHGFGIKSIKVISEKYEGIMKLNAEDGLFTLQISFLPYNS